MVSLSRNLKGMVPNMLHRVTLAPPPNNHLINLSLCRSQQNKIGTVIVLKMLVKLIFLYDPQCHPVVASQGELGDLSPKCLTKIRVRVRHLY